MPERHSSRLRNEIATELLAVADWKLALYQTVLHGSRGLSVEKIRRDDLCSLGQWLLGGTVPAVRSSEYFEEVRSVHAEFHAVAASVLDLALAGDEDAAVAAMQPGGEYARASSALTLVLLRWLESTAGIEG